MTRFETSACGGLHVELFGATVTLRGSGAMWLEVERTLVVADLH
ncbi:MAG: phosphoesterase, partial [Sphingomonadales bacterium 39-62-4]